MESLRSVQAHRAMIDKDRLLELHRHRRGDTVRGLSFLGAFVAAEFLLYRVLADGWSVVWAVLLVLVLSHFMLLTVCLYWADCLVSTATTFYLKQF